MIIRNEEIQSITGMKFLRSSLIIYLIICDIVFTALCFTINLPTEFKGNIRDECKNGQCEVTSRIMKLLGLFYTENEINLLDNINNGAIKTPVDSEKFLHTDVAQLVTDDGGACCSTYIKHTYQETMNNIFDEAMTIVNLTINSETTYQYIPQAYCSRKGSCQGQCVLEYKTITLLGYDENYNTRFGFFSVPGYCSCKNSYDN